MQASDPLPRLSASERPRWLVPLLIIAPIVAIFAPVIFADRSFAFRDGAHFYHPLFEWISREWGAGRVPLWNPQENCGMPVVADATSSIFYPGKLVFALPLTFVWNYKLYIIGHVVLAALGMYAFARRLKASEPAAAIAAVAYACGGNVAFQYCNVVFLVGAAWLPAAFIGIEEVVGCRCWRAMLFLAFVLAMMILGGDPQMAYHALLAAGLRFMCGWFGSTETQSEPPKLTVIKPAASKYDWLLPIPLLAGAAIIAALLSAVQILPSSEATKSSERAAYNKPRNIYEATAVLLKDRGSDSLLKETPSEAISAGLFGKPEPTSHHDRAYNWSVAPWRIIEFVWPNVSGKPFPTNRRWMSLIPGDSTPWTPTQYLGLLPFLAGAVALRIWRTTPTTRWLTWLAIVFALGSLGMYGLGWLLRELYVGLFKGNANEFSLGSPVGGVYWLMVTLLPTYVYFRYPGKLMVVAVCALAALAAPAIDRLWANRSLIWERALRWLAIASATLAIVALIGLRFIKQAPHTNPETFGPFDLAGLPWDVVGGLLHGAIVAWSLGFLLKKQWDEEGAAGSASKWVWSIAVLTAVEVAVANSWFVFTAPVSTWNGGGPVATTVAYPQGTHPRFFRGSYQTWHPKSYQKSPSVTRLEELASWEHSTLFPKYHLGSGLPLIESYGSLKSLDYESLLVVARDMSKIKVDEARVPVPIVLRIAACEFLVLPASAEIPYADKIATLAGGDFPENVSVWRMQWTLPRAHLVPRVVLLPPLKDSLEVPAVDGRAKEVLIGKNAQGADAIRDFRTLAVVEAMEFTNAELLNGAAAFASPTECEILVDTPQHVQVRARLDQAGLLVLADTFAPGWVASVRPNTSGLRQDADQGARATIHRSNRCFRGVELAAGEWLVDFEYRPQSFYCGATVSAIAWLLLVVGIGLAVTWKRLRR